MVNISRRIPHSLDHKLMADETGQFRMHTPPKHLNLHVFTLICLYTYEYIVGIFIYSLITVCYLRLTVTASTYQQQFIFFSIQKTLKM